MILISVPTLEVFTSVAENEIRKYKPEEFYDDRFVRGWGQSGSIEGLSK